MVDPVRVHCCDLGHVSHVSDSCTPAGYPHATSWVPFISVLSLPLWYDLSCAWCCGITFGGLIVFPWFRVLCRWYEAPCNSDWYFRYHAGTFDGRVQVHVFPSPCVSVGHGVEIYHWIGTLAYVPRRCVLFLLRFFLSLPFFWKPHLVGTVSELTLLENWRSITEDMRI